MRPQIIPERLAEITTLEYGRHRDMHEGFDIMEAVSYAVGEPWSDQPSCICPIITAFLRSWNDRILDDESRTALLLPLIPKLVGTRGSNALANQRAAMIVEWLVRTHTALWLHHADMTAQANQLAELPDVFDPVPSCTRDAVRSAWFAAHEAGGDYVNFHRHVVGVIVGNTAGPAAWSADVTAYAHTGGSDRRVLCHLALQASRCAIGVAVAAGLPFNRCIKQLQASVVDLITRMCDLNLPSTLTNGDAP